MSQITHIFYLATASELFIPICTELNRAELVSATSKVVLEKPLGHDLLSAQALVPMQPSHWLGKVASRHAMRDIPSLLYACRRSLPSALIPTDRQTVSAKRTQHEPHSYH